ncbi:hypothetical protein C0Z18_23125 [Trinickia dabaoshanensis]|uniref:Uncharacterized protein n=1 Tax=Trinickia dabaoshanensis TaxID=564714 RepID=A0A2N7VHC5_9BURK|nr:hypothetical protein C0Z18_23125 [Trinickia dabaoshanensis]
MRVRCALCQAWN